MLMEASLAPSSRQQYVRSWDKYFSFCQLVGASAELPTPVSLILLFIAHMFYHGSAPSSIVSAVSAISYFNKVNGFPDPANSFIVKKVLAGARNIRATADVRLPITGEVLTNLIRALPVVFSSRYTCVMLRAMMTLAFVAYLRIGEMVPKCYKDIHTCLKMGDVTISRNIISIIFRHFKHSNKHGPQVLNVSGNRIPRTEIYPEIFIQQYLDIRPPGGSTLFSLQDGSPMLRRTFDVSLKQLLGFCALDSNSFKGHSFRIGAATAAALRGESDAMIRAAGRWSSDAFRRYIRLA